MGLSLHISIVPVIMMVVSLQVWLPLGCFEEERAALLQLKDSLNYPNGTSLPSWRKGDARCCDWDRVLCSSSTGRVAVLFLYSVGNGELGDWYLNASLFLPFQELIYLYLWDNQIAGWVENKECLGNLEALYLSSNNITKVVASGGPTNLSSLYLSNITTYGSSFQNSLGAFPNLMTLGLFDSDLRGRVLGDDENSLQSLGALPSLKNLSLQALSGTVPFQGFLNLKNLELLDLSHNTLNSSNIFQTITMMTSLKTLKLWGCSLNSQLPTGLRDLNHLQELSMYDNDLSGFLPPCLANLTSLQQLDLSSNHLKIPMSLRPLYNLSKLKSFDGFDNEIYAEEDEHNLSPKFQLESLSLSSCG